MSIDKIKLLINEKEYEKAAAIAIHIGGDIPKQTRKLFADDKNFNNEKYEAYEMLLLIDADKDFDCYNLYLDYRESPERRFYPERRHYLKRVADDLNELADGKFRIYRLALSTGGGKSTLCTRFAFWMQGKFPTGETLQAVGGGGLREQIFSKASLFIEQYWKRHIDVFPHAKVVKVSNDKTALWLKSGEYADISVVSVEGNIEGFTQASNLLIIDDPVSSDMSSSQQQMDKMYENVIDKHLMNRRVYGVVVCIGTPVCPNEPLDRLYKDKVSAGWLGREYRLPMLTNDNPPKSNYETKLYITSKKFKMINTSEEWVAYRDSVRDNPVRYANFMTRIMMQPTGVGEYRFANVKRFSELPECNFDEYVVLDPADRGTDATVCWIARVYNNDKDSVYFIDAFFDRRTVENYIQDLCRWCVKHNIDEIEYEDNLGGSQTHLLLESLFRGMGRMVNVQYHRQLKNKNKRISLWSASLIDRAKFLIDEKQGDMYRKAMSQIQGWREENNSEDDAPDAAVRVIEKVFNELNMGDIYGKFEFIGRRW